MNFPAKVLTSDDPALPAALARGSLGVESAAVWAIGELSILQRPLLAFFSSGCCSGAAIVRTYDLARGLRDARVPVIGGFHSPMEKECLELLLRGTQPVVICPARSIVHMRLPAAWRDGVATGRVLVLSPFEEKHRRPTRALAEQRNRFVAALAAEIFLAHAKPGGRIEALAKELLAAGRRVWVLQESPNAQLQSLGARSIAVEDLVRRARLQLLPLRDVERLSRSRKDLA